MEINKKKLEPGNQNKVQSNIWYWQSDTEPWLKTDPKFWTFTSYSKEENLTLEKAFISGEQSADIGNYVVDLKHMLQINKSDKTRVRRVKRAEEDNLNKRFMIDLPPPQKNLNEKTFNIAFGDIHYFLNYLMMRTP